MCDVQGTASLTIRTTFKSVTRIYFQGRGGLEDDTARPEVPKPGARRAKEGWVSWGRAASPLPTS